MDNFTLEPLPTGKACMGYFSTLLFFKKLYIWTGYLRLAMFLILVDAQESTELVLFVMYLPISWGESCPHCPDVHPIQARHDTPCRTAGL